MKQICRNHHLNQLIIVCFDGGIANTDDESEYMYRTMNCSRTLDVLCGAAGVLMNEILSVAISVSICCCSIYALRSANANSHN